MGPGIRHTAILSEMRPLLPIAPKFAHPNSVIRKHFEENYTLFRSVSNGSGLPGFGPGWNQPEGPGLGQEPPSNPTCSVLAGLLPGPDINPRFFGRVEPGPRFHITVPATVAPIKYLSSDRITI